MGDPRAIPARPLTAEAFAPFGHVIEARGAADRIINEGRCGRHHDLAPVDVADARAGVSVFDAEPRTLPLRLDLVERHPIGSQAFVPMHAAPFLVVVAPDQDGVPGRPLAFIAAPGQGVSYARGTWHGVLTPLAAPDPATPCGLFAVIDYCGERPNLEEHRFGEPWTVVG